MNFSETKTEIIKAFAEARRLVVAPKRSGHNSHLKNHYATLTDVANAIDPAIEANGLLVIQSPTHEVGQPTNVLLMETTIIHISSGEWMSDVCQIPLSKSDCQAFGSSLTYARRYAKVAIFDLNMNDDDGKKGVRTAADCKRSIENAADRDEVDAIVRAALEAFKDDRASLRIVEDARASKIVALNNSGARPFNPAQPAGATQGKIKQQPVVVESAPTAEQTDSKEEDF